MVLGVNMKRAAGLNMVPGVVADTVAPVNKVVEEGCNSKVRTA